MSDGEREVMGMKILQKKMFDIRKREYEVQIKTFAAIVKVVVEWELNLGDPFISKEPFHRITVHRLQLLCQVFF